MSKDYRQTIIDELEVMRGQAVMDRSVFKARAYQKVMANIKALDMPVTKIEDLAKLDGIGEGIRKKIKEIIDTGTLAVANEIKKNSKTDVYKDLLQVYGIGPVKAKSILEDDSIRSIDDLKKAVSTNPKLLNEKQKIGLQFYEDILQRIPRGEMSKHERILKRVFHKVDPEFQVTVVGSYRRGAATSGDIDVLVCLPEENGEKVAEKKFKQAINDMVSSKYIVGMLALGEKKCMAVVKDESLSHVARRLDVLLTNPKEYPFAVLYFTGSDKFNISCRQKALKLGYTLNEHGMKKIKEKDGEGHDVPNVPSMSSEEDILQFLKISYITPDKR
jgi:DNA polymerase beta